MTTEATIEKAKAVIEEMRELLAKLEAERTAPRRNWPEKVEAGTVFRHKVSEEIYIMSARNNLTCLNDGGVWSGDQGFSNRSDDFTYLGHARDILTIRTDAHEPTGAELRDFQHIRDMSANPAKTLTKLWLEECLQGCHQIAITAIERRAR